MSTGLKIFLWIIAILAVLAIIGYFLVIPWAKKAWDNITFSKPVPESLNLQGINTSDFQNIVASGGSKDIFLTLGMDIENKNNFSIPFSAKINSFYNGVPISETKISDTIPANGTLHVSAPVTITLSRAQIQMLAEKLQGKKVPVDYTIDLSVYGIPLNRFGYTIKDKYEI